MEEDIDRFIGVLDLGTTSVRFLLFDKDLNVRSSRYEAVSQAYPRPGWVEEDPQEIWEKTCLVIMRACSEEGLDPHAIAALGICNQRESVLLWDKKSKEALTPLVVWQDRRTAARCDELRKKNYTPWVQKKTGLLIDPYFSATKLEWLLKDMGPGRTRKDIACGTLDSWVLFKLTGNHLTDASNASRTMLYDIFEDHWDMDLLSLFDVPSFMLPEVLPTYGDRIFGHTGKEGPFGCRIPICAVFGDQQSALFGQMRRQACAVKSTYGTGAFLMAGTGKKKVLSKNGLISTIACKEPGGALHYGLEGSVYHAGSLLQWLKEGLGILDDYGDIDVLASGLPLQEDLFVIPALSGLGAPYWDPYAGGMIIGLMRSTDRPQIIRACLEAIAYRTRDVVDAMQKDCGTVFEELSIDGGVSQSALFCQVLADITGLQVLQQKMPEITSLGAAMAAGLGIGFWEDLKTKERPDEAMRFCPATCREKRDFLYARWQKALARSRHWT